MSDLISIINEARDLNIDIIENNNSIILKESTCLYDIWGMGCGELKIFDELTKPYFDDVIKINRYLYPENDDDEIEEESYDEAGFHDMSCSKLIEIFKENNKVDIYFTLMQGEKFVVDNFTLKEEKDYLNLLDWVDFLYKVW